MGAMATDGSIYVSDRSGTPSKKRLEFIAQMFPHSVWLNPIPAKMWDYTHTIFLIRQIFPMFELSIDGLEKMVEHLMAK